MKNQIKLTIISLLMVFYANAQNKTILVEHFTNTLCSVCASRNPGLYDNVRAQQDVLHVAYHPSSPYSGCVLNQHNKAENDARTNYYSIYGGTPRIVLNGSVQSASLNYASANIFNSFKNISADVSVNVSQKIEGDLIKSHISIIRLTNTPYNNLKLHVLYVEDTIFYNAPNGEYTHFDVFRKSANGIQGTDIVLPTNVGDSNIIFTETAINTAWNKNRIYTLAFVQNTSDKNILNVAKSNTNKTGSTGFKTLEELGIKVYPNPAYDFVNIDLINNEKTKVTIINTLGGVVFNKEIVASEKIDLTIYNKGIYFLSLENSNGKIVKKLIIK
jgi:hypothetical protein